jgi:hypothetical protein
MRFFISEGIPVGFPVSKNRFRPRCLNVVITSNSVTRIVTFTQRNVTENLFSFAKVELEATGPAENSTGVFRVC